MDKRKILIVEDELITATDIKFSLESMGHEVVGTASTGKEALKLAVENKPTLALMDINLQGDMDGIDTSKKILNMGIPVIYLTAYADDETFEKANIKPASGFLSKPFDEKKLKRVIELAINREKLEDRKAAITKELVKESETKDELLDKLKDVDMKLYKQTSTQYAEESGRKIEDTSKKNRVFIVEDEQITALDIQLKLEDQGYEIVGTAATGQDAVNEITEKNPDLVLMDITLQGSMTGIDATKKIERLNIPVVYLTANTNDATINEALETAPYGYISKPFDDRELKQGVAIALKKHDDNLAKMNSRRDEIKDRVLELDLKQTSVLLVILGSIVALTVGYFSNSLPGIYYILLITLIIACLLFYFFAIIKK